jgi:hypothetical protein
VGARTVNIEAGALKTMLNWAVDALLIHSCGISGWQFEIASLASRAPDVDNVWAADRARGPDALWLQGKGGR